MNIIPEVVLCIYVAGLIICPILLGYFSIGHTEGDSFEMVMGVFCIFIWPIVFLFLAVWALHFMTQRLTNAGRKLRGQRHD